jgi:hypothetical protein
LNGLAKTDGHRPIDPLWADDPDTDGKKNLGPLIDRGLELCAEPRESLAAVPVSAWSRLLSWFTRRLNR